MPFLHQVGEEHQEERYHKEAYVHSIDIGISGNDHFVVAEPVDSLFDVECGLQEIELVVFVDNFLGHAVRVEGLSSEREHRLCLGVSHFVIVPEAESPSVMNIEESSRLSSVFAFCFTVSL